MWSYLAQTLKIYQITILQIFALVDQMYDCFALYIIMFYPDIYSK